jgi:hypothetical protein
MDISPSAMANMALSMQSASTNETVGTLMLRKSLNLASSEVSSLMQSVSPQLATSGTLGTQVNTYA